MHILSALNMLIWSGIVCLGYSVLSGSDRLNADKLGYYVHTPFFFLAAVVGIYVLYRFQRFTGLLVLAQTVLLISVVPYMFFYTGGI
jgi:hypothetical protein